MALQRDLWPAIAVSATMPTCNKCGGFVTAEFTRVFGDNHDEVFGCINCRNATELFNGAATNAI